MEDDKAKPRQQEENGKGLNPGAMVVDAPMRVIAGQARSSAVLRLGEEEDAASSDQESKPLATNTKKLRPMPGKGGHALQKLPPVRPSSSDSAPSPPRRLLTMLAPLPAASCSRPRASASLPPLLLLPTHPERSHEEDDDEREEEEEERGREGGREREREGGIASLPSHPSPPSSPSSSFCLPGSAFEPSLSSSSSALRVSHSCTRTPSDDVKSRAGVEAARAGVHTGVHKPGTHALDLDVPC